MSKTTLELTEVDQLREALKERTTQVESISKELERFSYSVSHDLRAPLRAIEGFSKILLEDYLDKLDEDGQRFLKIIDASSRKMTSLLDDLLVFSRMGRRELNPVRVDMNQVVAAAWEELELERRSRNIDFRVNVLPEAWGDPFLVQQIWIQLLKNSLKFTAPKPNAEIVISGKTNDDHSIYCIQDNGVGFSMKAASKLFGVFQRLHTEQEFEGNGIGLAVAHQIVSRHAGEIWAEAELDSGATFQFSLPRTEEILSKKKW